ncbi:TetR/AcrR family transcriptional regulator [Granulicella sp. dw_53]|uniref:TetR/AcrR family transcriptional regulator n=1 Tax=Granulicella sp. dw_53 TaxID=2719792 RepID=UPI001BD21B39|nr:TetR/AcrR family transcriptional regulator [Granulicella sp. dw_53]
MARPKEFDQDEALRQAVRLFCQRGYAATATDELMRVMGISRQSMYDTFGGKRQLYLEAFRRYVKESVGEQIELLEKASSPLAGIEGVLLALSMKPDGEWATGCMGVNAICEFGVSDAEVNGLGGAEGSKLVAAFEQALRAAKAKGEIGKSVEVRAATDFLMATLSGLKVAAKAGAAKKTLKGIALFAMRSLTSPE